MCGEFDLLIIPQFYLECRVKHKGSKVLKQCVQLILIVIAIYISLTRITDFKHSYSDVATGIFTGSLLAYVICFHVSDFFKKGNSENRDVEV